MKTNLFVGLDVHKKSITWCAKRSDGAIHSQGTVKANRSCLGQWAQSFDEPWTGAMEATLFTGWIYDFLKPYAAELKVANPLMLKAISASKKKNDRVDAAKISDCLRANLLPECYMAPSYIREMRRELRFRNMLVRTSVRMKNKISGILMEVGAEHDTPRLHGKKYFNRLLETLDPEVSTESVRRLLKTSRNYLELFTAGQKSMLESLKNNPRLSERVRRLQTIPGVGEVLALTWALEIGDEPHRFSSVGRAQSFCGLTSAQKQSGGSSRRMPISKQRNKHLQSMLIEAAKLAPRWNAALKDVYERERERGNCNRATLAVARKLVSHLLAVDKSGKDFEVREMKK